MNKPLISFCVKSYNQRQYLRAALEGAFAQTYRPLEIVVCDDGSTDGTWELIQDIVRQHPTVAGEGLSVITHRNERNLGNCKNWEMCGKLAHGELLVKADGDDVSLPERTERIVAAWIRDGKRATVVSHGCEVVDLAGNVVGTRTDIGAKHPHGACMAWSRACFEGWPEIDTTVAYDDIVYTYRARMLGGEVVLKDLLVRYCVGSGATSVAGEYRGPLLRSYRGIVDAIPQCRRDIVARGLTESTIGREITQELNELERDSRAWIDILEGRILWQRLGGVRRIWRRHGLSGHVVTLLLSAPWRVGDGIINLLLRRKHNGVRGVSSI